MTPDQVSMITSIAAIVKLLSAWPFMGLLFMLIIGPWLMALLLYVGQQKRFESVVIMYKNNVELCEQVTDIAKDLREVVMLNTQQSTVLSEEIKQNQYCPLIRVKKEIVYQKSGE